MKRSEFVDIVNEVMAEERKIAMDSLKQLNETSKDQLDFLAKALFESHVRAAEVAAITAGKIIEKAGLVQFEN